MPVYEYEPTEHDCLMCEGRVEVLQSIQEDPLQYCPHCGLPVKRVISRPNFELKSGFSFEKAAQHGLTSFRRVEAGKWEKVAGEGVDMIVGTDEDMQKVAEDKAKPAKRLDLDKAD